MTEAKQIESVGHCTDDVVMAEGGQTGVEEEEKDDDETMAEAEEAGAEDEYKYWKGPNGDQYRMERATREVSWQFMGEYTEIGEAIGFKRRNINEFYAVSMCEGISPKEKDECLRSAHLHEREIQNLIDQKSTVSSFDLLAQFISMRHHTSHVPLLTLFISQS